MTANVEAPELVDDAARPPRHRTTVIRLAVGFAIGTIFVVLFLKLIDVGAVAHRLEHLDPGLAALCGVVFLAAYAVRALRWRLFLAPDEIPARRIIAIYYVATFLNWLLPFQGGEVAKCVILRRTDGIAVNRSLATVAMDKAMDLLPVVVIISVVPLAQLDVAGGLWIFLAFPLLLLVVGGGVLLFASQQHDRAVAALSKVMRVVLPRRIAERVEPFVVGFVDTLLDLVRRPRLFLVASAYTVAAVALDASFCYLAFRAIGTTLSPAVVLFGYTFYNLAYIFPTPPAHLGSNELTGLLIFAGMFGVNRSAVGAMFVFSHPFTGLLMTVSALCSLKAIGLDRHSVLRLPATAASEDSA